MEDSTRKEITLRCGEGYFVQYVGERIEKKKERMTADGGDSAACFVRVCCEELPNLATDSDPGTNSVDDVKTDSVSISSLTQIVP